MYGWLPCGQKNKTYLPKILLPNAFVTDICPSPARETAIEAKKSGKDVPAAVTGRVVYRKNTKKQKSHKAFHDQLYLPVIPMRDGLTPHRQPHFCAQFNMRYTRTTSHSIETIIDGKNQFLKCGLRQSGTDR